MNRTTSPLGQELDKILATRNISYTEVAERTGIRKSYLSEFRHGHVKNPTPEKLEQLVKGIDITGTELRNIIEAPFRISPLLSALIDTTHNVEQSESELSYSPYSNLFLTLSIIESNTDIPESQKLIVREIVAKMDSLIESINEAFLND